MSPVQIPLENSRKFLALSELVIKGRVAVRAGIPPERAARALLTEQGITGVMLCLQLPIPSESVWYDVDTVGTLDVVLRDALAALTAIISVRRATLLSERR